ncbi:dimethylaniline monooxygenase (N-oxide-forming) [Lentinus tigrinus ALCF2SS1-7]|uniref:Dimethylaniline monooxygenase (N-oxide-forming) n=1 Tax=Lentinus tigrinus ALCF2SS1-6 TaxID=1328759 RepID=A0A5C2SVI8_9APHY|nr:dimethylaniline monooxygenase (N-oxide-forming) [Lentinus tigrinus ALCF2SS1-6]RPD81222.1 dimethylaniline monooxygenase (N-oxide-forming) [Lentinus tigrinus ALCF2SS1-7]
MELDPHFLASQWLSRFTSALNGADANSFIDKLFLPDGWLRDVLVLSWDIRSLEGRKKIASYLESNSFTTARIVDVCLDETVYLAPRIYNLPQLQAVGVEFAFTFECRHGHGRGYVRLLLDADGIYKAFTLLTELADLVGHEELSTLLFQDDRARDPKVAIPTKELQSEFAKWKQEVETNPHVLIVGGAQTGLQVAARFKQMQIPTLVIDREARIGDSWRKRYPSLVLHTPKGHHSFLYQPFPANWPQFPSSGKLADWIEHYAFIQDLIVWTKTEFKEPPTYHPDSQTWDVTVIRDGVEVKLRPAHIVLATGSAGRPRVPAIPNMELFRGEVMHSSRFPGGAACIDKHVLVVGAGNSAMDICQDLVYNGAGSVTMIQRSHTCAVSRDYQLRSINAVWPHDVPTEVSDFRATAVPFKLMKRLAIAGHPQAMEFHKEMHEKLSNAGLKVHLGLEGEGLYIMYLERSGGYWTDKGEAADMVADGRIQVRSGISPHRFTENGIVFDDGSEIHADVVVFATGYTPMREVMKEVMGKDVIDQTEDVFPGLDEEGELKGSYRPCGHPGLWFASADFTVSRAMSKPLALQIKAIQLGLLKHDGRRDGAVDGEGLSKL